MKITRTLLMFLILPFLYGCGFFQKKANSAEATRSKPLDKTVVLSGEADEVELATDISGIKTTLDKNAFLTGQLNKKSVLPAEENLGQKSAISAVSDEAPSFESTKFKKEKISVNSPNEKLKKDIFYKVKSGDTLMRISFEKYGNIYRWREIYTKNRDKISDYNRLSTGTVLLIEEVEYVVLVKSGKPYLIKRSDTLRKISKKLYGTEEGWKNLWKNNLNLIHDPNKIYAGFTLYYSENFRQPVNRPFLSLKKNESVDSRERKPAHQ